MKNYFVQLHIAIFLASCSGIFGKLIHLNEVLITWYRMFFAGVAMIVILLLKKKKITINNNTLKIIATGFLLGLHWIFFYGSIIYANVSVGVVCFCLSSFFTALLVPLLKRTKLSIRELLLSSLTIAGILLIFHFDNSFRTGIILGTVSSFLFSIFTIFNEKINKENDIITTTTYEMLGGFIGIGLLFPLYFSFFPNVTIIPTFKDTTFLLILSLACTVAMFLLLNKAQQRISSFTITLSFNLEPIYSIFLAIIIFNENKELTISFYLGLSLIILSLIFQMKKINY